MKRKVITILSIIGIVVLCVGAAIAMELSRRVPENPSGTVGNTAGNLYNDGLFCEDDGYVYFSNPYDAGALYRMRPDETDFKKFTSTQVQSINAAGNYVYYYQKGMGNGEGLGYMFNTTGIYRISKKNPNKNSCLDKIFGSNLVLADNALYYNVSAEDGTFLQKINTSGKEPDTLLTNPITPACVQNSTLYYQNTKSDLHLMGLNLSTGSASEILAEDVYMPIMDGEDVYYIDVHNDYSLVRYNLPSGTKTVLDETRTDIINLSDSYVYYQTSGDNPQFKRVSKDGSQMEVIADGAYHSINLTSQFVYFVKYGSDAPIYKIPLDGSLTISTFDAAMQAAADNLK